MKRRSHRPERVSEMVREAVGAFLTGDVRDPRIGFVTVTGVDTSSDLRHARVYVSVLGADEERRASLEGLSSAHGFLQRRVATELRLKHTPQLVFVEDETARRAERVERLLGEHHPPGTDAA